MQHSFSIHGLWLLDYLACIVLLYFCSTINRVEAFHQESIVVRISFEFDQPQWKIYLDLSVTETKNGADFCKPILAMLNASSLFKFDKVHFCKVTSQQTEDILEQLQAEIFFKEPKLGSQTIRAWKQFATDDLPAILRWWWERNTPGSKVQPKIKVDAFVVHTPLRNWKKLTQGVLQERIRDEIRQMLARSKLSQAFFDATINAYEKVKSPAVVRVFFSSRLITDVMLFTSGGLAKDNLNKILQESYLSDADSLTVQSDLEIKEPNVEDDNRGSDIQLTCTEPMETLSMAASYKAEAIMNGEVLRKLPNMTERNWSTYLANHTMREVNNRIGRELLKAVAFSQWQVKYNVAMVRVKLFASIKALFGSASPTDVDSPFRLLDSIVRSTKVTNGVKLFNGVPAPSVECHKFCGNDPRNHAVIPMGTQFSGMPFCYFWFFYIRL